jgi:hypothetical protein
LLAPKALGDLFDLGDEGLGVLSIAPQELDGKRPALSIT